MKIDFSYIGAMVARNNTKNSHDTPQPPLARQEVEVMRDGQAYKLTISDELKEVEGLVAMSMEEFYQKDINVINADPSNIFSYRASDQWLVFSQYLHESQFFALLSDEEVQKVEAILQHITDGMDSLAEFTGINLFGISKKQLNSYEAQLEFASSTAALKHFSNTFLSGDVKDGFDELIQDYIHYNKERAMKHQSIEERFIAARANLTGISAQLTYEQTRELDVTNKLGSTVFTETEIAEIMKRYEEQFANIQNEEDIAKVLMETKQILLAFVTKGISPNDRNYLFAQNFVSERAEDTFSRIEAYWKMMWKEEKNY